MPLPILSIFPFAVAERGKERRSTEHWPSGPAQSTARPDRPDAAAGIVPTDGRTTGNGWQWEWEWSGTLLVYGTPALDIVTSQFGGCSTSQCLTFIPNLSQNANGSCGSPPSSACSESSSSLVALEEEPLDGLVDLDLIEKQIAAQHNGLTAAEAEAVAVLAGLAAQGGVGR